MLSIRGYAVFPLLFFLCVLVLCFILSACARFIFSFVGLWIVAGCQWVSDNQSFHPIQYLCFSHILFLTSLFTVHVKIRIIYYPISSNPPICNCLCVFRCLICINPFIRLFSHPIFIISVFCARHNPLK